MVTRKEIAAMANVSESTVTRVLNGGYVSDEVRQRVLSLVDELNYLPNALAQGLRTRRTFQIGCIVHAIDNPFYGQIMTGVEEVAYLNGYVLTIYSSRVVEKSRGASFFAGRHDGIILLSIDQRRLLAQLHSVNVPIVTYSDSGPRADLPYVSVDLKPAVIDTVDYLVKIGHKRIGFIGTQDKDRDTRPRLDGFQSAMEQHGLADFPHQIQYVPSPGTMESGYAAMEKLYKKYPSVTAVIAMNDVVAFGIMRWIQDHGLQVPQDISLIGCDDNPYGSMSNPTLTTIQIPKREIGRQLMSLLLTVLEGKNPVKGVELTTKLLVRSSTQEQVD